MNIEIFTAQCLSLFLYVHAVNDSLLFAKYMRIYMKKVNDMFTL